MTDEFRKRCEQLDGLGVEFIQAEEWRGEVGQGRRPYALPIFKSIKLPFSPSEWCALCQADGEFYLGGCCGNLSQIQDRIEVIFRIGSGWVAARDLVEIVDAIRDHDDGVPQPNAEFAAQTPTEKMATLRQIVDGFYEPERAYVPSLPTNAPLTLDRAVSTLASNLLTIAIDRVFGRVGLPDSQAARVLTFARIIPALRVLNANIDALCVPRFAEGVAIVFVKDRDRIAENRRGPCIYPTQEAADNLIALWRKADAAYAERTGGNVPKASEFTTRPVRVSVDDGIVLL